MFKSLFWYQGVSFNGRTLVSKTSYGSSNLSAPATVLMHRLYFSSFYTETLKTGNKVTRSESKMWNEIKSSLFWFFAGYGEYLNRVGGR